MRSISSVQPHSYSLPVGTPAKDKVQCLINVQHVLTLALSPRLSRNQLELIGYCSCSSHVYAGAVHSAAVLNRLWEAPAVHGAEDTVLAKMAIDNHSKNSSHPSSITYLPLAYHYSSSLHPPPLLPSSSLLTSSPSHPFSDTTCQ